MTSEWPTLKHNFFAIFRVITLLCLPIDLAYSEPALSSPNIDVLAIKADALDFSGVHLLLSLSVENTNKKEITVRSIDYIFRISSVTLIDKIVQKETFKALKRRQVDIPVTLPYSDTTSTILRILASDNKAVSYTIKGSMKIEERKQPIFFEHAGHYEL